LVITNTLTDKTVTLHGEHANGGQQITFSDGVNWSYDQVQQKLLDQESAALVVRSGAIWGEMMCWSRARQQVHGPSRR
jgi:hypothetical protein